MLTVPVAGCHLSELLFSEDHSHWYGIIGELKESTDPTFTKPTEAELGRLTPRLLDVEVLDQDDDGECAMFDSFCTKKALHPPPHAGSNANGNNEEEEEEEEEEEGEEEMLPLAVRMYGPASKDLQVNGYDFLFVGTDEHGRDVWAGLVRRAAGTNTRLYCDAPGRAMMVFLAVEDARRANGTGEAYTCNVYSLRRVRFADGVHGDTMVDKCCFLYDVLLRLAFFRFPE